MNIINLNDTSENLFYIGGVVRDEILGMKSFDIDLTYVGNAIDYAKSLTDIEILQVNEPFGTVRIKYNNQEIDIASTRAEIYEKDGHLPTITEIGCSLEKDVLRRDFTVNALAKNVSSGEIIDYTGGLEDIKNKTLRILHDRSFIEDPTRILRALKFSVRFNFSLDEHSKDLRDSYLKNINYDMSYKRLKKELIETFNLNSQKAYDEFIEENIYKLVTEKKVTKPNINIEALVNQYKDLINPANIWLIYVGTLQDLSKLELTKDEKKILSDYEQIKNLTFKSDFEIFKAFNDLKAETILLYGISNDLVPVINYFENLKDIKTELTGNDLLALGIKPSPIYKECFDKILEAKCINPKLTRDDEIKIVKTYLK